MYLFTEWRGPDGKIASTRQCRALHILNGIICHDTKLLDGALKVSLNQYDKQIKHISLGFFRQKVLSRI